MTTKSTPYKFLHLLPFKELILWDVKRMLRNRIESNYPIVRLGKFITEKSNKEKLNDRPNEDFKILGVNNKVGLFDAYIIKGKDINQPYKKVEQGWLAFNPYRINVGSIGVKLPTHKYDYISPAYVVFSCNEGLDPEYLFLLFKTETFNKIIRENTTGSVRQNLLFSTLAELDIPLPPLSSQKKLVEDFHSLVQLSITQKDRALDLTEKASTYLNSLFGIKFNQREKPDKLLIVRFKDISQWGFNFIKDTSQWDLEPKYPQYKISQLCKVSSGGTPNTSMPTYYNGDIPWVKTTEVVNEIIKDTEQKITRLGLENSSAKMYPAGSLIVAMYGQGITRGRTAKLGIDAATNQACAVLFDINNEIVLTDFLWIYLINEYERLRELASGNNQPNLNARMILNYKIQVPPQDIQEKIIKDFFSFKSQINALKEQSEMLQLNAMNQFEQSVFSL